MFTRTLGYRHSFVWSPTASKGRQSLTGRGLSQPALVSAAPVVDIGSEPTREADALIQRLHERCTATDQPFHWKTSGPEASSVDLHVSAVTLGTASLDTDGLSLKSTSELHSTQARSPASIPLIARQAHGNAEPSQQATRLNGADGPSASDAATVEVDEHCSTTHPGSMCCTTTAVEKDATSNSCVVTLRTTVKLTDPKLHVAPEELEELAWLAVRDEASEAVSALNRRGSLPAGRKDRHRYVCNMLQNGMIRDAKRMENGFGHVSYLVTLEDKSTGKKMRAAFKPRVEGDCEGWHRVPIEVAAYQLNLLLGMDVVPPAVIRNDCDVDWTHYPAGGAFIYWCSAARQLNTVAMSDWSVPASVLLSDTRILDVLIQNSDRHAGHFLYAEHWADGDYAAASQGGGRQGSWRGRMSPVLIDHAAGFRQDAFVTLDHENAFLTGPTRRISERTYLRLRFLDAPSLKAALNGIITDEEVAALLSRRDAVLSFFDGLVAEHGYDNVVLEV